MMLVLFFFFFQAEDGIRDYKVTGVQTCALPICHRVHRDGTGSVSSSYGGDRILCMGRQPSDCRDNVEGNCGSLFPIKGRHYEYPRETQFKLESIELTTFENDCPVYERVHPLKGLSGE